MQARMSSEQMYLIHGYMQRSRDKQGVVGQFQAYGQHTSEKDPKNNQINTHTHTPNAHAQSKQKDLLYCTVYKQEQTKSHNKRSKNRIKHKECIHKEKYTKTQTRP